MVEKRDFQHALDAFLASEDFENVVNDDVAQLPVVQHVVELRRTGTYTVYSRREDALRSPDVLVLEIPLGSPDHVRDALRRALGS
ncbi:MAG: hypothetical protein JWO42_3575 [Chloroflexi bacterium]|nr:hypothetical protein [Chloroflexota bacterium]